MKRDAILAPVTKQWIAKDIPSYRSLSKLMKIAIHWFELNKLTPLPQLLAQNILNLGPSHTRGQNCLFMSKSVITMKNQVRPVCSPKDKIWSRTDKLQRCRRLPLEQAKLRQILENNSEGVLIRKWFDRWYVAESLCYKLRCKINHVHISQQHESRRGRPIFSVRISTISTRMDLSFARPLHV